MHNIISIDSFIDAHTRTTIQKWLYTPLLGLTALPDEGSTKSAKYPAAVNLEQISLALSMNYMYKRKKEYYVRLR